MGSKSTAKREWFAVCTPGLEEILADELSTSVAQRDRFRLVTGGVAFSGDMAAMIRVNMWARCATRVLLRVARFRVTHLAQLASRSSEVDWSAYIAPTSHPMVKATCRRSRIYHSGAAAERVKSAITAALPAAAGAECDTAGEQLVLCRIENNLCTLSVDTSGERLHRRGYRQQVTRAPMRETLAAALLRLCKYTGEESLLDPMCGSGTIAIEAALLSMHRAPGLEREFAFEAWPCLDQRLVAAERSVAESRALKTLPALIQASDRSWRAFRAARHNISLAGLADHIVTRRCSLLDLEPPTESGLLICDPPYGGRLGTHSKSDRPQSDKARDVKQIYADLGQVVRERFARWRVAFVTDKHDLARATGLRFDSVSADISHGGKRVRLYQTLAAQPSALTV